MQVHDIIEKWESVIDPIYEDYYEVSNTGKVRSLPRLIEPSDGNTSYLTKMIELSQRTNSIEKHLFCDFTVTDKIGVKHRASAYVHKLVAECFVINPNPKELDKVTHIDGDKTNNNYINLKWTNQSEVSKKVSMRPDNRSRLRDINIESGYYDELRKKTGLNIVTRSRLGYVSLNPTLKLERSGNRFIFNQKASTNLGLNEIKGVVFGFDESKNTAFVFTSDTAEAFTLRQKSKNDKGMRFTSKDLSVMFIKTFKLDKTLIVLPKHYFSVSKQLDNGGYELKLMKNDSNQM